MPSHRSASAPPSLPTATQTRVDGHDTPLSAPEEGNDGVGSMLQATPFQASARVPGSTVLDPTAVHAVAEMHDTPDSAASVDPAGLEVACDVQATPFQPSAHVNPPYATVSPVPPTAAHDVAAGQATPCRKEP